MNFFKISPPNKRLTRCLSSFLIVFPKYLFIEKI
jgi:hypothetical protein